MSPWERAPDLVGEAGRELGRELRAARADAVDRARDLLLRRVLREIARRARLERPVDELVVGERREQQHARREAVARDGVRDSDAVDLGQAEIDAGDVGQELADLLERLAAVADLRHELELRPGSNGAHDALPEERVVVGDDHSEPGHGAIVTPRCAAGGALVRSEETG